MSPEIKLAKAGWQIRAVLSPHLAME